MRGSAITASKIGRGRPGGNPILARKTPRTLNYSRQLCRFEEPQLDGPATLTKTGRSRISRANCPRWPGMTGAARFGPENGPLWACQHQRTYFIYQANCQLAG